MADIGHNLRIRYGLKTNPTLTDQKRWAELTRSLMNRGRAAAAAGEEAARTLFTDFQSMVYASEADTIEMLLRKADQ